MKGVSPNRKNCNEASSPGPIQVYYLISILPIEGFKNFLLMMNESPLFFSPYVHFPSEYLKETKEGRGV